MGFSFENNTCPTKYLFCLHSVSQPIFFISLLLKLSHESLSFFTYRQRWCGAANSQDFNLVVVFRSQKNLLSNYTLTAYIVHGSFFNVDITLETLNRPNNAEIVLQKISTCTINTRCRLSPAHWTDFFPQLWSATLLKAPCVLHALSRLLKCLRKHAPPLSSLPLNLSQWIQACLRGCQISLQASRYNSVRREQCHSASLIAMLFSL